MKTFIACLGTETNSFSSMPTGMQTFRDSMYFEGDATRHPPATFSLPLHIWRQKTEEMQGTVVESLAAFATPAGVTVRKVYEDLRDRILTDLRVALPVDMVLLSMHGAMTADGYDDCEGDTIARVREIVGPDVTIGVELDLHCSITPEITGNADVVVLFKEYPHTDVGPRAEEVFELCRATHAGEINPVIAVHDLKMINKYRTPKEPMTSVVAEMQAAEGKDGVLSVSFAHGFPWQDVPATSGKMLVIADGDQDKAAATAQAFGQRIWDLRADLVEPMLTVEQALDAIAANTADKPIVLADVADNAGGGAPSDNTFMLRGLLDRKMTNVVSCHYWDPVAVRFCQEAGEGNTLNLRLGGKCGVSSGDPMDVVATVNRIVENGTQTFGDSVNQMGTVAWLSLQDGPDVIVNTKRTQVFHPDSLIQMGMDPGAYRAIVLKSSQHFYAGFAPIASSVHYIAAEGAIPPDFANIPYRKFTDDYWPMSENPHG
ncbi:MAG: M81 family metallopeptidase [Pseudomonadota bacterium]